MNTNDMDTQRAEFDAANDFASTFRELTQTAIVDDDYPEVRHRYECALRRLLDACKANGRTPERACGGALTFAEFRKANAARCVRWHPQGIGSWSSSDWLTAVTGELGELASLIKMRNRERDSLPGNKFSPTKKQIADEIADVLTYLDLLAESLGVDMGRAAVVKFNEVSERVGFPDRIKIGGAS